MNPLTSSEVACLLIGCLIGAVTVFGLAGLAWFFIDVRRAVTEGTQLQGDGLERAKRRGDL